MSSRSTRDRRASCFAQIPRAVHICKNRVVPRTFSSFRSVHFNGFRRMIPSPLALLGLLASLTVIPTPVLSSRTHAPSPNAARNPQSRPRPRQQQQQQMTYSPDFINATNTNVGPVSLQIDTQNESGRNDTAPMLYGLMFEDISHSGDGGIYAELLMNRAFQGECVAWVWDWNWPAFHFLDKRFLDKRRGKRRRGMDETVVSSRADP